MRWWQAAVTGMMMALTLSACQPREVSTPRLLTDDDLRAMVLRAGDVPPDFKLTEEKLTTNDDYAQDFTDHEKVRDLVENWGRVSGLRHTFSSAGAAEKARLPLTVIAEVQRFSGIEQAKQAWRESDALNQYLKQPENAPSSWRAAKLGDDQSTARVYITDADGRDLVRYRYSFRSGEVIASVTTVAYKHKDDKGDLTTRLAKLVHERVASRLKNP